MMRSRAVVTHECRASKRRLPTHPAWKRVAMGASQRRIVMAARSVHVQLDVEAMPNTKLVLVGSGLSHGEWSSGLQPPESLTPAVTSISWQSECDGFLTGTQGWVRYYPVTPGGNAPANPPAEDTIYITWDNPYSGGNSYSSTAPSPYSISGGSVLGYVADNDTAVFTLSFAGELQSSNTPPALADFGPGPEGSQLVIAYVATNKSNDLLVTTTDTLGTWSQSNPVTGQQSQFAPALTEFNRNGQLVLAYVANNGTNDLLVAMSKTSSIGRLPTRSRDNHPPLGLPSRRSTTSSSWSMSPITARTICCSPLPATAPTGTTPRQSQGSKAHTRRPSRCWAESCTSPTSPITEVTICSLPSRQISSTGPRRLSLGKPARWRRRSRRTTATL